MIFTLTFLDLLQRLPSLSGSQETRLDGLSFPVLHHHHSPENP